MKKTRLLIAIALALSVMVPAMAQGQTSSGNAANSLGKTTLDTTVYADDPDEMNYGDGIPNGEWVTAEMQGVVIGLRAMERHEGLLGVTGTNGNRVGVYEAATGRTAPSGTDDPGNNGTWNYEWSVDLSRATGNAEGRTLSDYRLVLEQDFTEQSLFGLLGHDPVELFFGIEGVDGVCSVDAFDADSLCQQSWNPGFGNTDFDPTVEGTYNLRLVLTPVTFNGPSLAVAIQVNVTDE